MFICSNTRCVVMGQLRGEDEILARTSGFVPADTQRPVQTHATPKPNATPGNINTRDPNTKNSQKNTKPLTPQEQKAQATADQAKIINQKLLIQKQIQQQQIIKNMNNIKAMNLQAAVIQQGVVTQAVAEQAAVEKSENIISPNDLPKEWQEKLEIAAATKAENIKSLDEENPERSGRPAAPRQ